MVFINHLKKNNVPFTVSETHINDDHPIRGYESWPEEWNPKSDVQQWFDDHVEVIQIGDVNYQQYAKDIAEEIVFRDIGPDDDPEERVYD